MSSTAPLTVAPTVGAIAHQDPDVVSPPEGNPRFPLIDGLRAMAALSVVIFHADQFAGAQHTILGRLASHLDVGVAVFFLITGFLLYRPFYAAAEGQAPPVVTRLFYWRRFLRIVPAYWVALLLLMPVLTYAKPFGLPNIFFIQIYRPGWSRTGIPPAWSVCVEVSFYLLLPLYSILLARRWKTADSAKRRSNNLRLLALIAVSCFLFRAALAYSGRSLFDLDPLPGTMALFCVGMSMAIISVSPGSRGRGIVRAAGRYPNACWILALLVYLASLLSLKGGIEDPNPLLFTAYATVAALLLAPLVFRRDHSFIGQRVLETPTARWLGLVSYGIYLYHYPLLRSVSRHLHVHSASATFLILAAIGIPVAAACGSASYIVVERPVLRLKRGIVLPFQKGATK